MERQRGVVVQRLRPRHEVSKAIVHMHELRPWHLRRHCGSQYLRRLQCGKHLRHRSGLVHGLSCGDVLQRCRIVGLLIMRSGKRQRCGSFKLHALLFRNYIK